MTSNTLLENYNLILIRYNEIWLKSNKVKMRMLHTLMNNVKSMLNRANVPFHKYQLSNDSTRILFFFKNEHIPDAIKIIKRIFGVYSLSPALRTSIDLDNIIERVIEMGNNILEPNDTFALRVKRSGNHQFTSKDIAEKGGEAILTHFKDLNLKVNLGSPKKRIFIEVRSDFTYLYTEIIQSKWGGLPIEPGKKIMVMDVGRLQDGLAGFLLARRGSQIFPVLFKLSDDEDLITTRIKNWNLIARFIPGQVFKVRIIGLTEIMNKIGNDIPDKSHVCAMCRLLRFDIIARLLKTSTIEIFERIKAFTDGVTLNDASTCPDNVDLESIALNYIFSEYPIFTPLVGLSQEDVKIYLSRVSKKFTPIKYCVFSKENQQFNLKLAIELYKSLDLDDSINKSLGDIVGIKLE